MIVRHKVCLVRTGKIQMKPTLLPTRVRPQRPLESKRKEDDGPPQLLVQGGPPHLPKGVIQPPPL